MGWGNLNTLTSTSKAPSYLPVLHFSHLYHHSFGEWIEEPGTGGLSSLVWKTGTGLESGDEEIPLI